MCKNNLLLAFTLALISFKTDRYIFWRLHIKKGKKIFFHWVNYIKTAWLLWWYNGVTVLKIIELLKGVTKST